MRALSGVVWCGGRGILLVKGWFEFKNMRFLAAVVSLYLYICVYTAMIKVQPYPNRCFKNTFSNISKYLFDIL